MSANIVGAMKPVPEAIKRRQLEHFHRADAAYGAAGAKGLGLEWGFNLSERDRP